MSNRGREPQKDSRLANCVLAQILVEMLRSALEWEADSSAESESDSGLNQDSTGIDCPPTEPRPKSRFLGVRDEDAVV